MEKLPSRGSSNGNPVTVAGFYHAGMKRLSLELVAGRENLELEISEPIVNRPGLALTGFYKHFAWRRVQLIGNAETAYLDSLSRQERLKRLRALIDRQAKCFVYTNGIRPGREECAMAEQTGAVLFVSPLMTRNFAGQAAIILERLAAPTTTLYGTMVEVAGLGVLFEGDPGMGKSETALGLIKRGCALISDDLTCIRKEVSNDILYGSASAATAGYMEIRGIGIMHIPSIFGVNAVRAEKRLQLVITLKSLDKVRGEIDRVGQTRHTKTILGVDIPNVIVPVSEGRDLVNLVEAAAQQQKLLQSGLDPVESLSERLRIRAESTAPASAVAPTVKKTGTKRRSRAK